MDRLETLASSETDADLILKGFIAEDAVHPDDQVGLLIPSYDLGKVFGPSHFEPRPLRDGTILFPVRNDPCLVALDEEGEAHLLTWWAADPTNAANLVTQAELDALNTSLDARLDALELRSGWAADGTNSVAAGATEPLEGGAEIYDPENVGTAVAYTVPRTAVYTVWAWAELQNVLAGAELQMDLLVGGVVTGRPLIRDWNSGGAGASAIGGGHITRAFVAANVISAQVRNGDSATRNILWRLTIKEGV